MAGEQGRVEVEAQYVLQRQSLFTVGETVGLVIVCALGVGFAGFGVVGIAVRAGLGVMPWVGSGVCVAGVALVFAYRPPRARFGSRSPSAAWSGSIGCGCDNGVSSGTGRRS